MTPNIILKTLIALLVFCKASFGNTDSLLQKKGYAPVNGQKIYYEIYGKGKPLVLLHGLYTTIEMNWGKIIPMLAKSHQLIALEMQSHGHTPYSDRKLTYPVLAEDVAGVMQYLKIGKADILGYSFGGNIAFQFVIANPKMVDHLILLSCAYKTEGWQKDLHDFLKTVKIEFFDHTPIKDEYLKTAPDTTKWHKFLRQMVDFDNSYYNLGEENVRAIKSPVLLISGDNDGVEKSVLIETYKMLGGCTLGDVYGLPKSQLAILPGSTHGSLVMQPDALYKLIENFTNEDSQNQHQAFK